MSRAKVIEGYVYEYCHPDGCHMILLPRRISEEEMRRMAEEAVTWRDEEMKRTEIERIMSDFRDGIINWWAFWGKLEKEAVVPCYLLEEFKGKKVRITIEVIE